MFSGNLVANLARLTYGRCKVGTWMSLGLGHCYRRLRTTDDFGSSEFSDRGLFTKVISSSFSDPVGSLLLVSSWSSDISWLCFSMRSRSTDNNVHSAMSQVMRSAAVDSLTISEAHGGERR